MKTIIVTIIDERGARFHETHTDGDFAFVENNYLNIKNENGSIVACYAPGAWASYKIATPERASGYEIE